jgi:hypothetical protein
MNWSKMMATVLPCGHTKAQHMYADGGELELQRNELCHEAYAEPIPDYADIMLLQEFVENVELGTFIDWDGSGYYANPPSMYRDARARPSEIMKGKIATGYTHVAWFNK